MTDKELIKKILVPVDGSGPSLMALENAAIVAKKSQATVTVLHVIPSTLSLSGFGAPYRMPKNVADEILGSFEQKAEQVANDARTLFNEERIRAETETLRNNDPADAILEYSKDNYDLIIIGGHGENEKDKYALGSVTKKVMMHTICPTLITKTVSRLSNFLVCIDGSKHSYNTLDYAVKLAEKMGSEMTLINVQDGWLHRASAEVAERFGEQILSKAVETVGEAKLKIEKKLEHGVPSDVIVEVAEKGKYDIIALGSIGMGAVRRCLLGSVSDDVSHKARCSVLIVPRA